MVEAPKQYVIGSTRAEKFVERLFQSRIVIVDTGEEPVQIYEARFAGRNRGRILEGGRTPTTLQTEAEVDNNRNHRRRIDGPWVFALRKTSDCRCFKFQRSDRETHQPVTQREVAEDSIIHFDDWSAYGNSNQLKIPSFTSKSSSVLRRC